MCQQAESAWKICGKVEHLAGKEKKSTAIFMVCADNFLFDEQVKGQDFGDFSLLW